MAFRVGCVSGLAGFGLDRVCAAFPGKLIGTAFLTRISEKTFRRTSLGFTLLTGALGVATGVWPLI